MNLQKMSFPECEYFREEFPKRQIVLHHTVSATAKSAGNWWMSDKGTQRIAAAFIVEKDGTVFKLFDPKFWAYHIGKGSTRMQNQNSIAIEIVNEGGLMKSIDKGKDSFHWFNGQKPYTGEVITLAKPWRGYTFFAAYTAQQYEAVMELLNLLCECFSIPDILIASYLFSGKYRNFKGIVSHHNLRADKSDVSRAFDYSRLRMAVQK